MGDLEKGGFRLAAQGFRLFLNKQEGVHRLNHKRMSLTFIVYIGSLYYVSPFSAACFYS